MKFCLKTNKPKPKTRKLWLLDSLVNKTVVILLSSKLYWIDRGFRRPRVVWTNK